jgi:hypothetical protein
MTHYVVGCYGNVIGPIFDRVYSVAVTTKRGDYDDKTL